MSEENMTTEERMEVYKYGLKKMLPKGTPVVKGRGYIGIGQTYPDMNGTPCYPVKFVDRESSGHDQFAIYRETLDKDAQLIQFETIRATSPGSALYAAVITYEGEQ